MLENVRVLVRGATVLTRAFVPYLLQRRPARVVAIDPGEEDEGRPWFAPIRGLARDEGIPLASDAAADLVLDLDPDARPATPQGLGVRVLAPPGARSPDLNRALLGPGEWKIVLTDGRGLWGARDLTPEPGDDAALLLTQGVRRALELLDAAWESLWTPEGTLAPPKEALPRPLIAGRFRPQETFLSWELPGEALVARIRACAGPWGGARTHLGATAVWLQDAELHAPETPPDWTPGTIVEAEEFLIVASGRGLVRIRRLRPGWQPIQSAGRFATASGLGPGHLLA
jgi:hypothetical protein